MNTEAASRFSKRFLSNSQVKELPEPVSMGKVVGPGVIILATAMGSGEILFWPSIASQYGFQFVWLVFAALLFQYVLNTEFTRYTLATGEPVVTGFGRLSPAFHWFFLAAAILPWMWPGWATGGATAIGWIFGTDVTLLSVISLLAIGLLLTTTKAVYRTMELFQKVAVAFVLIVAVLIAALVVRGPEITEFAAGFATNPLPIPPELAIATLIAALAFSGAGGTINLSVSNWVRDKGLGMGAHAPRIENVFTGEVQSVQGGLYRFEVSEDNTSRWRTWWKLVCREEQLTFLGAGAFGLAVFMLIAAALAKYGQLGSGMAMVQAEVELLREIHGEWLGISFAIAVAAIFLTSALGVLDHSARLAATIMKTAIKPIRESDSTLSSESALYFMVLWSLIAFGVFVLLGLDVSDPPALLTISGSLSGVVMFVYSVLIIVLSSKMMGVYREVGASAQDNPFRVSFSRYLALGGSVLLYGAATIALVYSAVSSISG